MLAVAGYVIFLNDLWMLFALKDDRLGLYFPLRTNVDQTQY